jgi:nucleotide-binding universal stress UspA family protein
MSIAPTAKSQKFVVAVDLTDATERVLDTAFDLATNAPSCEVHALYVHEPVVDVAATYATADWAPEADLGRLQEILRAAVERAIARHGSLKVAAVVAHGASGSPAREIALFAAQLDADLVILGTHGRRGLRRAILGSVAEHVVRTAGCPVHVVRAKQHDPEAVVPAIEPVCPACADRRFETDGRELWCARHSERHPRAHVYSYEGPRSDSARPWGFTA